MIIEAIVTLGQNEAVATAANDISVTVTLNDIIENPSSTFCERVDECLGISPSGATNKYLNEKGEWLVVSGGGGGAVDSVNGQTGDVVLDADDIDETATRFWLTDVLKTAYDSAVAWISTNGTNLINHLSNTSNPHSVTAAQVGAISDAPNDANAYVRSGLAWVIGYTKSAIDTLLSGKQNALGFTPENVANKTGTIAGSETSTSLYPTLNGITSWIKNTFVTWVGAHGSTIVDADTILVGKSGVLGTRTWAQIKATLSSSFIANSNWVDYSGTSTIVGWSSFTTKSIQYLQLGNVKFYKVVISGVSNSATTTFTLDAPVSDIVAQVSYCVDNGLPCLGRLTVNASSDTCSVNKYTAFNSLGNMAAIGTKTLYFRFFVEN